MVVGMAAWWHGGMAATGSFACCALMEVDKVRVGLAEMKSPARAPTTICANGSEEEIGHVTSGGFGPTLGKPVAMGYVSKAHAKKGTVVDLVVRGKPRTAVVTKMPFVKTNYYRA